MRGRLVSFALLVSLLALVFVLDRAQDTARHSLAALALLLLLGAREAYVLLRGPAALRALGALALVGLPGACLLALRARPGGLALVLYVIAVAKMTDNGALFIGRQWGRRKLAPQISPGKTVAGFWGGLLVGTLTAGAIGPDCTGRPLGFALAAGLALSLAAVAGDLLESLLKRRAGVKDSGALLPGIGGVLDLLDSILLAAPVALALQYF